ncbi:MAG TPA: DUF3618 domain-containing protein [Actinomycetota bacterium]|nr:DUF3618 domain-containing protein [Actinomycetota bacterium]
MGEDAAATVTEIEQTRDRLEESLTELQDRLPAPAVLAKRAVGIAATGGAATTMTLFVLRRRRKKKAEAKAAEAPVNAVIQVLPDEWASRIREGLDDGRWRPWAAGVAGLYVVFRLAELRQLRRMNRTLLAAH